MFLPLPDISLDIAQPPAGALPPPPIVLADRILAADTEQAKAGDFETLFAGDDPIDAALGWQFTVRQGSGAALGDNGHRLHLITKATEQAPVQLEDEGRRVVAKFVQRGQLANVTAKAEIVGGSTAMGAVEIRATNALAERGARIAITGEG